MNECVNEVLYYLLISLNLLLAEFFSSVLSFSQHLFNGNCIFCEDIKKKKGPNDYVELRTLRFIFIYINVFVKHLESQPREIPA